MTTPGSSSHGVYTRSNLPLAVGGLTATAFDSSRVVNGKISRRDGGEPGERTRSRALECEYDMSLHTQII